MNDEEKKAERNEQRKKNAVLILILLLLLLVIGLSFSYYYLLKDRKKLKANINHPTVTMGINSEDVPMDDSLTDTKDPLSDRQVYFAGFENFTVGPGNVVYLENLEENEDIFMVYEIYIDGELVHKTGRIPAGQYSEWVVSDDVKPGEYDITIKNVPYYSYDNGVSFSPLNFQPENAVHMTVTSE